MSLEGAIAAHRFGLGARPGEIVRASANPRSWLLEQIDGPAEQPQALDGQPFLNAGQLVLKEQDYRVDRFMEKGDKVAGKPGKGGGNIRAKEFQREMEARFALGFSTDRPLAERLVWFWSNHFTVSSQHKAAVMYLGAFEREAIRPNIHRTFEDMLYAVCMHPAMQTYLDNGHSIGPNSPAARKNGKGLNENLGRELMELYTLGVDGGYTQADVIAMAKLLTGWGLYPGRPTGFGFYPERHEPGAITLRSRSYAAGWDGGVAALHDLAHDPATARHVARKFATHFIADAPSAQSVTRLETVFNDTHGNLHALAEAAVNDPVAWTPKPAKMRTPVEFVTASMRLAGWPHQADKDRQDKQVRRAMAAARQMGELPLSAPSPKGWPDTSDAWTGADSLLDRIEWAKEFGNTLPVPLDAAAVAEMGLGPLLRPATRAVMAKAATPGEAVALVLSSPEFQRR